MRTYIYVTGSLEIIMLNRIHTDASIWRSKFDCCLFSRNRHTVLDPKARSGFSLFFLF